MTTFESIPEALGVHASWREQGGVCWLDAESLEIRKLARLMNSVHARFVTITGYELPGNEGLRLEYHWDLDGRLLGFPFHLAGNSIDSIYDICEAAGWIEREIHEGFAIDFVGRVYEPLLLRPGDKPGVNMREVVT